MLANSFCLSYRQHLLRFFQIIWIEKRAVWMVNLSNPCGSKKGTLDGESLQPIWIEMGQSLCGESLQPQSVLFYPQIMVTNSSTSRGTGSLYVSEKAASESSFVTKGMPVPFRRFLLPLLSWFLFCILCLVEVFLELLLVRILLLFRIVFD